jgi:hypothetical protein
MTFDSFFDLLAQVFCILLHILQRSSTMIDILKKVIGEAKQKNIVIGQIILKDAQAEADEAKAKESLAQGSSSPRRKDPTEFDDDDELGPMEVLPTTPYIKQRSDSFADLPDSITSNMTATAAAVIPTGTTVDIGSSPIFALLLADVAEILRTASELSTARCAKLFSVRSDQNAQLNAKDFYRFLGATREFVVGVEALCGHHGIGLKGAMQSQV